MNSKTRFENLPNKTVPPPSKDRSFAPVDNMALVLFIHVYFRFNVQCHGAMEKFVKCMKKAKGKGGKEKEGHERGDLDKSVDES